MLKRASQRGFTLIELLIGVTLVGVLLALGAPPLATYLQNAKVGSATSAYFSGIQVARTEAIRRNVAVEFLLTNSTVTAADDTLANAATPTLAGRNWLVRAASGATFTLVDSRSGAEGEAAGAQAIQVAASSPAVFNGTIAFNGFGGTATGQPYSLDVSNPTAGTCAAVGGPIRCRRITVSPGGQIAACDPAVAASGADSRGC